MSDKQQFSYSPIVVGVIIALIGILTGFYIADNAKQQLAANQKGTDMFFEDSLKSEPSVPIEGTPQPLDELPPLDPVVVDAPLPEEVEDDTASHIQPPVSEPEVEARQATGQDSEPVRDVIEETDVEPVEVDDFEEVPQEVLDSLG
ncbi:MAG: hypothetical protein K5683_08675 [Prevotella sp.]|nr:hypothetical protein [Prevotella sp.]